MAGKWLLIQGFENYLIDDEATIISKRRKTEMIIKPFIDSGYWNINLYNTTGIKKRKLHRVFALHFLPGYFDGAHINHKDGNKLNYKLDNLEWCTPSENLLHAHRTGLRNDQKMIRPWPRTIDQRLPSLVQQRIAEIRTSGYIRK